MSMALQAQHICKYAMVVVDEATKPYPVNTSETLLRAASYLPMRSQGKLLWAREV